MHSDPIVSDQSVLLKRRISNGSVDAAHCAPSIDFQKVKFLIAKNEKFKKHKIRCLVFRGETPNLYEKIFKNEMNIIFSWFWSEALSSPEKTLRTRNFIEI